MKGTRNKLKNNGHTGEVLGKQGRSFKVEITDGGKRKKLVVRPAHLRAQQ
jgi:large subunit ribosomal protein L21e